MTNRVFRGAVIGLVAGAFLAGSTASAQAPAQPQAGKASSTRRVAWTIVGAAAGFGLGAWYGLHKFDDAVNSDRKVWTSAIVGAAAGGIAGGLLSRNMKPAPYMPPSGSLRQAQGDTRSIDGSWAVPPSREALRRTRGGPGGGGGSEEVASARELRMRIRTLNREP